MQRALRLVALATVALLALALFLPGAGPGPAGAATAAEPPPPSAHLAKVDPDKEPWKEWTKAQWKAVLTPAQVEVCREAGTERAWTGAHLKTKAPGVFTCSSCGQALFSVDDKFDSGTGWPSFTKPVSPDAVETKVDLKYGMIRTEVVCSRCDAHLGHVFQDGPAPTGERWCINSVCLDHRPADSPSGK